MTWCIIYRNYHIFIGSFIFCAIAIIATWSNKFIFTTFGSIWIIESFVWHHTTSITATCCGRVGCAIIFHTCFTCKHPHLTACATNSFLIFVVWGSYFFLAIPHFVGVHCWSIISLRSPCQCMHRITICVPTLCYFQIWNSIIRFHRSYKIFGES